MCLRKPQGWMPNHGKQSLKIVAQLMGRLNHYLLKGLLMQEVTILPAFRSSLVIKIPLSILRRNRRGLHHEWHLDFRNSFYACEVQIDLDGLPLDGA